MKTSNKILIAFASALILLPVLGMVYTSQVYYTNRKDVVDVAYKDDTFKEKSPYMISTALTKPFTAVSIKDAKGYFINIRLVQDEQYGVKVQDKSKNSFKFEVDEQGQLQISLANHTKDSHYYGNVIIYAPNITKLSITKADGVELNARQDSLQMQVNNSGNVSFSSKLAVKNLAIKAADVSGINLDNALNNLVLELTNTPFFANSSSLNNLKITTNSAVELIGSEGEKEKYSVKNLEVNTTGSSSFKIENINVIQCSGSFSDGTKIEMPAGNLKQMFKK